MPGCCSSNDYDAMFTSRGAAAAARKFRRHGLTGTASDLASAITASGIPSGSILEVGGGLGEIQVTLLEKGNASTAVNVDLASTWEIEAQKLAMEKGLESRTERIVGDFVRIAGDVRPADIVILHRVVCCYSDWRAMLAAATAKADRLIALTFPIERWWTKTMVRLGNLFNRLRNVQFRAYVHSEAPILDFIRAQGFEISSDQSGFGWRTLIAQR